MYLWSEKGTIRPTVGLGAAVNSVTPDMLQRVWSELDYRSDVCRVTRWGHIVCVCVCDTTWNCMSLCNCSHQFCKNIPVSFQFITTWNKGVFFCTPCTILIDDKLSSGYFPGVWVLKSDVSGLCVGSIFTTCWRWNRHRVLKRRLLILRRRRNTQKTIYQNISCACIDGLFFFLCWTLNAYITKSCLVTSLPSRKLRHIPSTLQCSVSSSHLLIFPLSMM
jgi:hypothetical protein